MTGVCFAVLMRTLLAPPATPPHIAHPTLPSAAWRSLSVVARTCFAIALDALLYLFVNLAQRHAAGSFQVVGIAFGIGFICHENDLFRMGQSDLDPSRPSPQARTGNPPRGVNLLA